MPRVPMRTARISIENELCILSILINGTLRPVQLFLRVPFQVELRSFFFHDIDKPQTDWDIKIRWQLCMPKAWTMYSNEVLQLQVSRGCSHRWVCRSMFAEIGSLLWDLIAQGTTLWSSTIKMMQGGKILRLPAFVHNQETTCNALIHSKQSVIEFQIESCENPSI